MRKSEIVTANSK
ncbi:unnamed protein product [Acanthoscelides obtectus]|uniref:Uncharacterized protein n=1 Tax=Acanthoscelides obtectus TaxID=200917 RepID=A0A9P0KIR3_ACAOB|nr:unnamed protein product [Acanthoscelides obtectus]CAK1630691.1 hypothetical protein AOBTE_LOCUS6497 [Acanthoscelides obtectus]